MPKRKSRRINFNQIGDIIGLAVSDAGWRKKLLASPEETLTKKGFKPHPEAVAFIKSLKRAGFEKAAGKFKPRDGWAKHSEG